MDELLAAGDFGCHATMLRYDDSHNGVRCRKLPTASDLKDGEMGFLLFLAVVALGAIVWLLFRIDAKLLAIGDMIHDVIKPEAPRRLTD